MRNKLFKVVYYLLYPENLIVRESKILLPIYALNESHDEVVKKSAISVIEAAVHHPKVRCYQAQEAHI